MDWAFHESQIRFDIRAEREECERLFQHPARVLQDRLARCGGGDRTRKFLSPSGRESTEKKRRRGDCCIRREY